MREPAVSRARAWLLEAGAGGFAEATHEMTFPHALGFSGEAERQRGDLFSRAVLGQWLLDMAEALGGDAELEQLAVAQADHLAANRLTGCTGGWSYFPGLPELPPDLDSLAAVIELFVRVAPSRLALCEPGIALALSQRTADGAIPTFLIAPADPPERRKAMERGVALYWGQSCDADAMARFHHALLLLDRARYAPLAPLEWLAGQQQADGSWRVPWYAGAYTGTRLVLRLFGALEPAHPAAVRARAFLAQTPLDDSAQALAQSMAPVEGLLPLQQADGAWPPSAWIRMPMGRPGGHIQRVLTWKSRTLTTALCLRALLGRRD